MTRLGGGNCKCPAQHNQQELTGLLTSKTLSLPVMPAGESIGVLSVVVADTPESRKANTGYWGYAWLVNLLRKGGGGSTPGKIIIHKILH